MQLLGKETQLLECSSVPKLTSLLRGEAGEIQLPKGLRS